MSNSRPASRELPILVAHAGNSPPTSPRNETAATDIEVVVGQPTAESAPESNGAAVPATDTGPTPTVEANLPKLNDLLTVKEM